MFIKSNTDNFRMLYFLDKFLMEHKGFICGGCFKNIFNKEKVKDLDVFFRNSIDYEDAVELFDRKSVGYSEDFGDKEDEEYQFVYENEKVKAYRHLKTGIVIELCHPIYGSPKEIISQFDFTITKFAYYKVYVDDETGEEVEKDGKNVHIEDRVIYHDKFFEHLHMKRLVADDNIPFPMSTFERMIRYAKYGYFPCRETKIKIIQSLRELDDKQVEISESLYDGFD